jgi:hypothetical protein
MAAKFDRLSPWKKGRPMIDILLLSTTVFVVAVVLMVFPPPTASLIPPRHTPLRSLLPLKSEDSLLNRDRIPIDNLARSSCQHGDLLWRWRDLDG